MLALNVVFEVIHYEPIRTLEPNLKSQIEINGLSIHQKFGGGAT